MDSTHAVEHSNRIPDSNRANRSRTRRSGVSTSDRYTIPDTPINAIHSGDRWAQYRAYLYLSDPVGIATLSLEEVSIEYHQRCNVEFSSAAPVDIGDQFTLQVYATYIENLHGFSFDIHFDANILSALSVT
jgi:hypothetical protein